MKKKLVIFSGAGVSAESGVPTFRDVGTGLWENHSIEDVATPEGWEKDKELVLKFYNDMRSRLKKVNPNEAHFIIGELEKDFDVTVITQNVDDLHERGGSTKVIHLHGSLLRSRSTVDPGLKYPCVGDINIGDKCGKGSQLRPDIVWFKENVFHLDEAAEIIEQADILVIIGTSLNVFPAAGLVYMAKVEAEIYAIDPAANRMKDMTIKYMDTTATKGMKKLKEILEKKK